MSYPEDSAEETWEADGAKFSIVFHELAPGYEHYCGYVRFPSRFTKEQRYNGILTYVPVHGGITYADEDDDGSMVYGFDCGHADDDKNPQMRDKEWLRGECQRMAQAISIAAAYEDDYLLAPSNEIKADVIDQYHQRLAEEGIEFDLHDNFGALINVMFGGNL